MSQIRGAFKSRPVPLAPMPKTQSDLGWVLVVAIAVVLLVNWLLT